MNLTRSILVLLVLDCLAIAALSLCQSCASGGSRMVAYASTSGAGDVRSDGDSTIVVGDIGADFGLRSADGSPVFVVPVIAVGRDQWFAKSRSRDYERRAPLTEPMPYWASAYFTQGDLERLAARGMHLVFEPAPPPVDP